MTADKTIFVLNKRLALAQVEDGFRSSMDSVLLAAACPAQTDETLLDIGCGVGGAGLCVLARVPNIHLTGIDIQGDHTELARQNAALNNLSTAHFFEADIRTFIHRKGAHNILFDNVICNPPYNEAGAHVPSPSVAKALAMGHMEANLKDWIDCANRNLKSGGSLTLIHKADQIDKIILALDGRFGAVEVIPLWPHAGKAAKRVIMRARKDRKGFATMHAGLVLHQENGLYTAQADTILRDMQAL